MVIRISASDLESYRYWKDSDAPLSDLIERLMHTAPPTRQMSAGRAFANLMESAADGVLSLPRSEGWLFDFSDIDFTLERAPLREIKAEKVYATPYGPVTLVCKCDGLDGRTVIDQKLTERWDAENYLDSLQWRAYLDVFGAQKFIYDVFLGRYSQRSDDVLITDYHRMAFYSYPDLGKDVERAVVELASVITQYAPTLITPDAQSIERETTT